MTHKIYGPIADRLRERRLRERHLRRSERASAEVDATLAEVVLDAQRRLNLRPADGAPSGPRDPRRAYLTQPHD